MSDLSTTLLLILFWSAFAGVAYTYIGYPLLIYGLARYGGQPVKAAASSDRCSVVIAAYNEGTVLPQKLASLLQGENGNRIGEIWVGSDGSTDAMVTAVNALGDARIKCVEFPERRGKPSVLNELIPRCTFDVVVLMDARQTVKEGALGQLLDAMQDSTVGVVSGELVFQLESASGVATSGVDAYWRYEKFIRKSESSFRSVPGATGALYAIRRSLFHPIPADTLLDDVAIPMRAIEQGFRCVFNPQAIVYDRPSTSSAEESIRKKRTIAGNVQVLRHNPGWLIPMKNPIWFEYISHKVLRLVCPFLLILLVLCHIPLLGHSLYKLLAIPHALIYLLAGAGWIGSRLQTPWKWVGAPYMFVSLNVTTVIALWDAARGRYRVAWDKAPP